MKLVLQLLLFLVATSSLAECIRAQSLTEQLVDEVPAKLVELALKNGNIVRGAILFHQGNTGPLARQHVLQRPFGKSHGVQSGSN
jgi:hypothetical protein